MVVHLPWPWVVVLDVVAWAVWSAVAGWWTGRWTAARGPAAAIDGPLLRLRLFEVGGSWYQRRLRVKTWKRWLPEAGRAFGGRSKRHLPPGAEGGLPRFLGECRRARL